MNLNNNLLTVWKKLKRAISVTQSGEQDQKQTFVSSMLRHREAKLKKSPSPVRKRAKTQHMEMFDEDYSEVILPADQSLTFMLKTQNSEFSRDRFEDYNITRVTQTSQLSQYQEQKKVSVSESIKNIFYQQAMQRSNKYSHKLAQKKHERKTKQQLQSFSPERYQIIKEKTQFIHKINIKVLFDLFQARCADNEIVYVPDQAVKFIERFRKLSTSTRLDLNSQFLGVRSCQIIANILSEYQSVLELNLSQNDLKDSAFEILAVGLRQNNCLIHLNLSRCNPSTQALQVILVSVPSTLVSLDLSGNRITQNGILYLQEFLDYHTCLQFLNLGEVGSNVGFFNEKIRKAQSLCSLDLNSNLLREGAQTLFANLPYLSSLEELNLSFTSIGDKGIEYLSTYIKKSQKQKIWNVKRINLEKCDITVQGFKYFIDSVHSTNLEQLILSRNDLGEVQMLQVVGQMFHCRSLIDLQMGECNLNSKISIAFEDMIKCRQLRKLNMSNNNFDNEQNRGILKALDFVQTLNLMRCRLGQVGAKILFQNLKNNTLLINLNVSDNQIPEDPIKDLIELVTTNTKILKVDMSRNQYSFKQYKEMNILLQRNFILSQRQQIPKFKQQMQDLKQYDNMSDQIYEEQAKIVHLRTKTEENFFEQRNAKEKLLEHERLQTENLKELKEQSLSQYIEITKEFNGIQNSQQIFLNELDVEQQKIDKQTKQINISIKNQLAKNKELENKINQIKFQNEKQIDHIKQEFNLVERKLNQALLKQTMLQQDIEIIEKKIILSPKKRQDPRSKKYQQFQP